MKPSKVKLFFEQPKLNKSHIEDLTKRGLIVPFKSPRVRETCTDEITNATANEVVSYRYLAAALSEGKISQNDARRLLAIEATRPNGRPRHSHISRLLVVAFSKDRSAAMDKINTVSRKLWEQNRK